MKGKEKGCKSIQAQTCSELDILAWTHCIFFAL